MKLKTLIVKKEQTQTPIFAEVFSPEDPNFQISWANNLQEALYCLRENPCDLVLLELSLPDSKGLETLIKTKSVAPNVSVIVIGDNSEKDIAAETLRYDGVQDYFIKGKIRKEALLNSIRSAMERSKLLKLLKKNEEEYRFFTENCQELICRQTKEGNFIDASPASQRLLGYKPEELADRSIYDFFHPDDRETAIKLYQTTLNTPGNHRGEYRLGHQQGDYMWMEITLRAIRDPNTKTIEEIVVILRDINLRKKTELEQQNPLEIFPKILNKIETPIFVKDEEHRWVVLNDAFCEFIGKPREQLIGKSDYDFFPPEQAEIFWQKNQAIFDTGISKTTEEKFIDFKGNQQIICTQKSLLEDRNGQKFLFGIINNITQLVSLEQVAQIGSWQFDIGTGKITWTKELFRIFGLDPLQREPTYQEYLEILHPDDRGFFNKAVTEGITEGKPYEFDFRIFRLDGSLRYVFAKGQPIFNAECKVIELFGIAQDITERKQGEIDRAEKEAIYRAIAQNIPNGWVMLFDENLRFTLTEGRDLLNVGLSKEYLEGKTLAEAFTPEISQRFTPIFRAALAGESTVVEQEYAHLIYQVWTVPVKNEAGEIIAGLWMSQNINEPKNLQLALERQSEFLNSFIRTSPSGIAIIDREFRHVLVNESLALLNGISVADNLGKTLREVRPDISNDIELVCQHIFDTGSSIINTEISTQSPLDSSERNFLFSAFPIGDLTGVPVSVGFLVTEITEIKQTRKALEETQKFLEKITATIPNILSVYDREQHCNIYANRELYSELGYSVKEIEEMGSGILEKLMHPEDFAAYGDYSQQLQAGQDGEIFEFEYRLRDRDGFWRWILSRDTVFLRDSNGQPVQLLDSATDITEAKIAQEALRLSEERLQMAVEGGALGIWDWNISTGQTYFSPQWKSILGYEDWEIENNYESWERLLHPEDISRAVAAIKDYLENRTYLYEIEFRMLSKSGEWKWISAHAKAFEWDKKGIPLRMIGTHKDVTQRKESEEDLRDRENFLGSIYDGVEHTIFVVDITPEGDFRYKGLNHAGERMLGIAADKFCGKTPEDIFSQDAVCVRANYQRALQAEIPITYEECLQLEKGEIWCLTTLSPQRDFSAKNYRIIGTIYNITERKNFERRLQESEGREREKTTHLKQAIKELKRTQAQLIHNEKMVSLGQLVAGIAHEINNPVSFIYGNLIHAKEYAKDFLNLVDLYQQYYPLSPEEIQDELDAIDFAFVSDDFMKLLTSMEEGATRIRDIVLSLRNFSRLDESERKAVDLHEGIDSTLLILQHRLKAVGHKPAITVIKEYGKLPLVDCYASQLNQVFMNILCNAIDAVEMNIFPSEKHTISPTIRISTELRENDKIYIKISDNGAGIPEEFKPRIFDPFFTTKPVGSGTGLGLSISWSIVEKHRGSLQCFSEEGLGTEFVITLSA